MLEVLDIQDRLDFYEDDEGYEYPTIVVTAIYDPDDNYNDYYFGRESDEERAIEMGIDSYIYAYLPDCYFEDLYHNTLSPHNIRTLWDYIEKHYD